jgi:Fur family peroxide stress response transcriptional regulator
MDRRETPQREAILNVLRHTDSHPTADWVYDEVRKIIPNISKGTVYRNLNLLQEMGEISALSLSGAATKYDGRQENHYHFRCLKCGLVFDLEEPINDELNEKIAKSTGLKISYHRLEFRGLCRDCQQT